MPDLWTVGDLNRYVKQSLEMDYRLQDLRVTGEVSGFRAYPSGHWYFTLKDGGAVGYSDLDLCRRQCAIDTAGGFD